MYPGGHKTTYKYNKLYTTEILPLITGDDLIINTSGETKLGEITTDDITTDGDISSTGLITCDGQLKTFANLSVGTNGVFGGTLEATGAIDFGGGGDFYGTYEFFSELYTSHITMRPHPTFTNQSTKLAWESDYDDYKWKLFSDADQKFTFRLDGGSDFNAFRIYKNGPYGAKTTTGLDVIGGLPTTASGSYVRIYNDTLYADSSLEIYKENIIDSSYNFRESLKKLPSLKEYNFKGDTQTHIGFIADELHEILPEFCTYNIVEEQYVLTGVDKDKLLFALLDVVSTAVKNNII